MSKGWDNSTLKKLKALMGKGLSTSEIGKRLGLSKNAVVGKLNRLGWNAKAGATSSSVKSAAKATKKTTTATASKSKTAAKIPAKKGAVKTPVKKATTTKVVTKKTPVKQNKTKKTPEITKKTVVKDSKTSSKTSAKSLAMHQRIIQHSLEMANLKPNQCRWPIGDPDSENFHFCGETVFTGKPYCYEHCRLAYQFTPPTKKQ